MICSSYPPATTARRINRSTRKSCRRRRRDFDKWCILKPQDERSDSWGFSRPRRLLHANLSVVRAGARPVVSGEHPSGVLLFLREERGYLAARAKGIHHLGPQRQGRILHRAAEVRRQRPRFRHGDPDSDAAEAKRDAARFL